MKKILFLTITVIVLMQLMGCRQTSSSDKNKFTEDNAIARVIKDHSEFPSSKADIITQKLPAGGPSGRTADVKFKTNVEKSSGDTYDVTLTKDWGIAVNSTYVKSSWKYRVTPDKVVLIDKVDNDYLPDIMK